MSSTSPMPWATRTDGGPMVQHLTGGAAYDRVRADRLNGKTNTVVYEHTGTGWTVYKRVQHI